MKNFHSFLLTAVCLLCFSAGMSAEEVTRTFAVPSDYKALNVSSALTVTYSEDATEMTVYADSDDIENFEFKCEGATVSISLKSKKILRLAKISSPVRVVIPASKSLEILNISGASKFTAEKVIDVVDLSVDVSGSSSFTGEVSAVDMDIYCSGTSSVNISGEADEVSYNVSGASRIGSGEACLVCEEAKVSVSSASSLWLEASDKITGHVSGASKVTYSGECTVSVGSTGASAVNKK